MSKQDLMTTCRQWCIRTLSLLVCLCMFSAIGYAQNGVRISGSVVDKDGPLSGVSVSIKGSPMGTSTNVEGKFTLTNVPSGSVLVVRYLGFVTQEIPIGNQTVFDNIAMTEDLLSLDEVVVVGYGTMRKKDLTGSVVQIRPDNIAIENPKTIQDVLRGTAGMTVGYDPSAKGGGGIEIRGQRSVYTDGGHNEPLIILDGQMFHGELSEINVEDIGQFDILKDASAAAIYGAQAANGVIIISTKRGKIGKPVVNISSSIGIISKSSYREVYSPDGYMKLREDYWKASTYDINPTSGRWEPYQKSNTNTAYFERPGNVAKYGVSMDQWRGYTTNYDGESDESIYARRVGLGGEGTQMLLDNYLAGKSFDWWDNTFQTGFNHDHNVSISGASDKINYYMSFGYLESYGAISGDEYRAIRSNLKVDGKVNDWLEIGANVNFQNRTDGTITPNLTTASGENNQNQIRNSPFGVYRDEDGNLAQYPNGGTAIGKGTNFDFERQFRELDGGTTVLNTIFNTKVKLPFGISYSFNIAPRFQFYHRYYWESAAHPSWASSPNGLVDREHRERFDWNLNNQIHWDKTFAQKHKVNVTLAQEAERRQSWQDQINARNFQPSDALGYHNTANSTKENSSYSTSDSRHSSNAMLARLFYSYDDKYMLTASLRRDGYSAFGQSNPYATFPSLAGAWTFTNEDFINSEVLNYGKVRLTWGRNGNRSLGDPYVSLANLATGGAQRYGYINSAGELINFHYLQISRMANPNLRWETSEAINFGLDFGLLKNRLSGTFEFYTIDTDDMIMNQRLPQFSGFSTITTNLGQVNNRGIELTLNSTNIKNSVLEWNTTFNFSYNKSEIKHLYYEYEDVLDKDGNVVGRKEKDDTSNGWFIGKSIGTVWSHKMIGIWQESELEEAKKYGQVPGDPKVWNNPDNDVYNDDGTVRTYVYNDDDRVFQGETKAPYNLSMRNDFTLFKNWTLSFSMYSRLGHISRSGIYLNRLNTGNELRQGSNSFVSEYWTPENPSNEFARIDAQGPAGGAVDIQRTFNRSFIRLDNVSLGYSVPKSVISKYKIERLRLYGTVRNAAIWQKEWPYGDTETGNLATRTFSFGLNVTF